MSDDQIEDNIRELAPVTPTRVNRHSASEPAGGRNPSPRHRARTDIGNLRAVRSDLVRRDFTRLAGLLGICGFAITQPVLGVFGDAPEQFVFRGASTTDIILFALLVAIGPAVLLWLPGVLAGLPSDRAGNVAHLAAVTLGLFVGLLQAIHHLLGTAGPAKALLAALAAGVGAWLYRRFEPARSWAQLMAFSSVIFVGLFLFSSPTGELAFADPPEVVELATAPSAGDETLPDIVMVVLDELPTALLLDQSGEIDPIRYPALAAFADDATWYRSYTTVTAETVKAVPAILSGQLPTASSGSVWTSQPDNLFRLLGGTYHLTVSESLTRLCPEEWCGTSLTPPGAAISAPSPADSSTTPGDATLGPDRGGLSRLLRDALDAWGDQIALNRDVGPVLTGFEETAVEAPTTVTTTSASPLDTPTVPDGSARPFQFPDDDRASELPRVEAFRAAFEPSEKPTLYYLHLLLPHAPYVLTESGEKYDGPAVGRGTTAEWDTEIVAQQMALQMQFTDRLLGDILDDATEAGVYDDAIVVVLADHAAGLDSEKVSRYYDGTNASALMVTPLFIKAPNQSAGVVSDAPVEAVDVLPTLADMLDIEVPWPTDGASVLGGDPRYVDPGCEDIRRYVRFEIFLVGGEPGDADLYDFCASDIVPEGLDPLLGELRPDDEWDTAALARLTPFDQLMGRPWTDLEPRRSETSVMLDRSTATTEGRSPPLGVVRGSVEETISQKWVAVAIDGRVAGISKIYDTESFLMDEAFAAELEAENQFTVIVPSELLSEDGYDIRVAALESVDGRLVASELSVTR